MEQLAQRRAAEGGDTFELWPEHVPALQLWREAAQSQLRWDQGRPTGIAWESLRAHPAACAIPEADRERVLLDVSVMEPAWVEETARRISRAVKGKHG